MITREEIRDFAREFQLDIEVIEKDYSLGWLLAGISNNAQLRDTWVFKGGTCLKKCFFETYRFSEDLDFTVLEPAHLNAAFLGQVIEEIAEWIYENSGLELLREERKFEVFINSRGNTAAQGRVGYRGPLARRGNAPRIKLDLASDELLVLPPIRRAVHHPYSDAPAGGIDALCYAFEEIYAEKMRALAERQRPRDLYDVIHLHRHQELRPDRTLLLSTLQQKCEFKGIGIPNFELLSSRPERQAIEVEWEQMLAHQLPVCPPFSDFWNALPQVFAWLESKAEVVALPSIAGSIAATPEGVDETWHAPAMISRWGYASPLEAIRFAAVNRLLVELEYENERGERSTRAIEPYALRRTRQGDLLLYAVRSDTGSVRSYRVDRIRAARAQQQTFVARYAIELTASGPLDAPSTATRPVSIVPKHRASRTTRARPKNS